MHLPLYQWSYIPMFSSYTPSILLNAFEQQDESTSTVELIKLIRLARLIKLTKIDALSQYVNYIEVTLGLSPGVMSYIITVLRTFLIGMCMCI